MNAPCRMSNRKPNADLEKQDHNGHDFLIETGSRKVYRKEYAALFSFHRLQLRHRCYFATRTLAGTQEMWLKKKFISLVEALHTGMQANVAMSVSVSEDFSVNNRVKQECVLAPTVSSLDLVALLEVVFKDTLERLYIQTRKEEDWRHASTDEFEMARTSVSLGNYSTHIYARANAIREDQGSGLNTLKKKPGEVGHRQKFLAAQG